MIEVTMGEYNKVERIDGHEIKAGHGLVAGQLGMKPCIYHEAERAHFDEQAVGADAAMRVKVGDLHDKLASGGSCSGMDKSNLGTLTCTFWSN